MRNKAVEDWGEVRKNCGVARYHQLYNVLSGALADGMIASGSALPSESELMARFQVSRNTVRRALARLEQEKRIIRRRGSRSFARRQELEFSADLIAEVLRDFPAEGADATSRLVRVRAARTPEFIRRKDPGFGDTSLVIQRCRSIRNVPVMFSSSHVPEHLGARLTRGQLAKQVVLSALESLGAVPSSAEQLTTAILADAVAARYLEVEQSSPLLCIQRLVRDSAGRSIEHQTHAYRPDRFQLRSSLTLERTPAGPKWSVLRTLELPAAL